jgi:uncharacterized protein YbcI
VTVGASTGIKERLARSFAEAMKSATGRSPIRTQVHIDELSVVTIIGEGTLTEPEATLASEGQREAARRARRKLQGIIRDRVRATVEEVTGRRVVAALSDHAIEPDLGAYVFVLKPAAEDRA